jgi:hypothetical protein
MKGTLGTGSTASSTCPSPREQRTQLKHGPQLVLQLLGRVGLIENGHWSVDGTTAGGLVLAQAVPGRIRAVAGRRKALTLRRDVREDLLAG